MSIKLAVKWLGPYRIAEVVPEKGTYFLKELNGTRLKGSIAGNQPKRFHYRQRLPDVLADVDLSDSDQPIDFALENPALGLEINSLATSISSGSFSSGPFEKSGRSLLCHDNEHCLASGDDAFQGRDETLIFLYLAVSCQAILTVRF